MYHHISQLYWCNCICVCGLDFKYWHAYFEIQAPMNQLQLGIEISKEDSYFPLVIQSLIIAFL